MTKLKYILLLVIGQVWATVPEVKIYEVVNKPLFDTYHYPAKIDAEVESKIYAESVSTVKSIQVKLGTKVKPGTILMRVKRNQPGYAPADILSEITGNVVNLPVKVGSQVKVGDLLAYILDPDILNILIEVPAKEKPYISIGQLSEFKYQDITFPAVIAGVAPIVKPGTGTVTVELEFYKDKLTDTMQTAISELLFPGMIGVVEVKANMREGMVVPIKAVFFEKEKDLVKVIIDGKVAFKEVKLGKLLDNGQREVLSGLQVGDKAILRTGKYLKLGEEVKVKE